MKPLAQRHPRVIRVAYLLAVCVLAYGLTWSLTALGARGLYGLGLVRSEAVLIATLTGFLAFPLTVMGAMAARQPGRHSLLLLGLSLALGWVAQSFGGG